MQTASEIPSFLTELKHVCGDFIGVSYREGFNQAIDLIAKKRLEVVIDREKLAGKCYELRCCINGGKTFQPWDVIVNDKAHPAYWVCLEDADAIILAAKQDKDLVKIEVVK